MATIQYSTLDYWLSLHPSRTGGKLVTGAKVTGAKATGGNRVESSRNIEWELWETDAFKYAEAVRPTKEKYQFLQTK